MHGNYQNNTNTCANCHSTHQAKNGVGLLKNATVYDTCISCHDGSLGFYNVFETDMSKDNGAGTFGGSHSGNMSIHLSTGEMSIDSASGAETAKEANGTIKGKFIDGKWNKDFTCTSCHSPHGSSIDRLLQTNPNGYSRMERHLVNGIYYGGLIKDNIEVTPANSYEDLPGIISGWGAPSEPDKDAPSKNYKAIKFPISGNVLDDPRYESLPNDDSWIIQNYKYDKYLEIWKPLKFKQVGPFSGDGIDLLTKTETEPPVKLEGWKAAVDSENLEDGEKLSVGYLSIGWYGYLKVPNEVADDIKYVTNIVTLFDFQLSNKEDNINEGETLPYNYKINHTQNLLDQSEVDGNGNPTDKAKNVMSNFNQFNEWCASCHIGFNISSEQKDALESTIVYTHHSSSEDDKLPCVQCHYSHGTDATWMKDKNGDLYNVAFAKIVTEYNGKTSPYTGTIGTVTGAGINITELEAQKAANNYLTDQNLSSALKRYSNASSCFRCHGTNIPL